MKIIIIQENGRHAQNREYRECFSIQRALTNLGHDCHIWGKGHDNFNTIPNFPEYDLIFDVENYDSEWIPPLKSIRTRKILWAIDTHVRGENYYDNKNRKHGYDIIFQSTKKFAKTDKEWLPNCYDNSLFRIGYNTGIYDIGFCGNVLNRREYIERLEKEFKFKKDIFVIGEKMVEAIKSYRIHFNRNISGDINYRSFETIGCGTVLLTNFDPQYIDLGFVDLENCILYKDIDDAIEKCKALLPQVGKLSTIAANGFNLANTRHTYLHRMKTLIERVKCL